ncbi:MAG: UDP-glucose 4-epimerase GalE [Candidatus Babeliaceae bacterium]
MINQWILVTGGAGYIGSHIVFLLHTQQYNVIVIDKKQPHAVQERVLYMQGDYGNTTLLQEIFQKYPVSAVIHCAAYIEVGESVKNPALYYENNVIKTFQLLEQMRAHAIQTLIFSSSCAVYGIPHFLPLTEQHACKPISPYGNTKYMIELLLADYARAYDLRYIALRYFNVAGAQVDAGLGEMHQPESHIIPLLLQAAVDNKPFTVFGDDYATADGTCVRDYVHVSDLAQAHEQALVYCQNNQAAESINVGIGWGYSVKEVIAVIEQVTGKKIEVHYTARRAGDPAILIADASRAAAVLGWQPCFITLIPLIESAYQFYIKTKEPMKRQQALKVQETEKN